MKLQGKGLFAIQTSALGTDFAPTSGHRSSWVEGGLAIVPIRGPLEHHTAPAGECDSYEDVERRVREAMANAAVKWVLLVVNSPGGMVSGCFDTVRDIRRLSAEAKKPVWAFCENACSAAYALATAATYIVASESAEIGSIGVLSTRADVTVADAAQGVRFALITSGARKADTNPHSELSSDVLESMQSYVDAAAEQFFKLVSESRGLSVEKLKGLEASVFFGGDARKAGLVDQNLTLTQTIKAIAGTLALGEEVEAASRKQEADNRARVEAELAAKRRASEAKAARAQAAAKKHLEDYVNEYALKMERERVRTS